MKTTFFMHVLDSCSLQARENSEYPAKKLFTKKVHVCRGDRRQTF